MRDAARTDCRKRATPRCTRPLSSARDWAPDKTSADATPASAAPRRTSAMLVSTCDVPLAARCTFAETSCVAAPCCSTDEEIAAEISKMSAIAAPISLIDIGRSRQRRRSHHQLAGGNRHEFDDLADLVLKLARKTMHVRIAGVLNNSPDNLALWIENPQAVVPGNAMPNMGISHQDSRDITAFLYTLK